MHVNSDYDSTYTDISVEDYVKEAKCNVAIIGDMDVTVRQHEKAKKDLDTMKSSLVGTQAEKLWFESIIPELLKVHSADLVLLLCQTAGIKSIKQNDDCM